MRPHGQRRTFWPEDAAGMPDRARGRRIDRAVAAEGLAEHHEAEPPRWRIRYALESAERDLAAVQARIAILRRQLSGELPEDYCAGCGGPCREDG